MKECLRALMSGRSKVTKSYAKTNTLCEVKARFSAAVQTLPLKTMLAAKQQTCILLLCALPLSTFTNQTQISYVDRRRQHAQARFSVC